MHDFWCGFWGVFVLDMKRLWINRIRLVTSLVQPLLYLFVLGSGLGASAHVGGHDYQRYIFPGIVVMSLLFNGSSAAISIVVDRQVGFLKAILVAPVPRSAITLGKIASGATQALLPSLGLVMLAPLVGVELTAARLACLLPAMVLSALVFSAMGVGLAARLSSITVFPVFSNTVLLPMFFLSGAIYPLDGAPTWLSVLARLDPAAYAVDLMRGSLTGHQAFAWPVSVCVLLGFLLPFVILASMIFDAQAD